jgi:hypothetical protein
MEKWLITVQTTCTDPSREKEFNDWYDEIHVPDVLKVPGIVRATRYENAIPSEEQPKFLILLEVEADDVWKVTTALQENSSRAEEEGRMSELLKISSGAVYRQIAAPVEST